MHRLRRRWMIGGIVTLAALAPLGARAGNATSADAAPALAAPAATHPASESPALNPIERARLTKLRGLVTGADAQAAQNALREMQALGPAARNDVAAAVRQCLARDRTALESRAYELGDPAKLKAQLDDLAALRQAALDNIAKLEKGEPVQRAHEYYDKLLPAYAALTGVCARRQVMLDALARRPAWLQPWREAKAAGDDPFDDDKEARLQALAERGLGMSVAEALAVPAFGKAKPPAADHPAALALWHAGACRQIAAYNQAQEPLMNAPEWENFRLVNAYREALGLLPLEADARLVQSARRHSKEMADLKYFAHESPTESEKSMVQRMHNAGYGGNGWSENIASGPQSGKAVFWMWFDSPGHHKNMAGAGSVALGVGKWQGLWTQNFGAGPRLVLADEAARQAAGVKGAAVKPQ